VIALSLAAQAWPPSNEAPRPVMRPSAWILFDILSVRHAGVWLDTPVGPKKDWVGSRWPGSAPGLVQPCGWLAELPVERRERGVDDSLSSIDL
jgi:hypothetical protein